MNAPSAAHRLQGLAVLIAGLAAIGLAVWSALTPIVDIRQSIIDAADRIERFEVSVRSVEIKNIDTSMVVSTGESQAVRSLAIQRALVDDTAAAGLQVRQLSAAVPRNLKQGLVQLSYEIDVAGDLGHLTAFLKLLSDRRPALLVDKLVVKPGLGSRPDLTLAVQMTISAYVLPQMGRQ